MDANDKLISWLQDAYAMEQSLERTLERHRQDAEEFPPMHERLTQHLAETRNHAIRIKGCLESLRRSTSTMKTVAGNVMGAMQGMATAVFEDELVKNALADYAMEHFEIACYTSLIAAAEDSGHTDIARICGEILRDEIAMADWLEDQIPVITRHYLHLQQTTERS